MLSRYIAYMADTYFSIPVLIPDTDVLTFLSVHDTGKLFETELFGDPVSLIRNQDHSWNLVKGDLSQETVNIIGEAIETHHLKKKSE